MRCSLKQLHNEWKPLSFNQVETSSVDQLEIKGSSPEDTIFKRFGSRFAATRFAMASTNKVTWGHVDAWAQMAMG